jgi:hypothetical protein
MALSVENDAEQAFEQIYDECRNSRMTPKIDCGMFSDLVHSDQRPWTE